MRRLIGWGLILAGLGLGFLSMVVLGTYPIGDTFLSMTLKEWGVVIGCGAGMLTGLVLLVIGEGLLPHQLRASQLRTPHILLRRTIGVVFILAGLLVIAAVGLMFLIGSGAPRDGYLVFTLAMMGLVGLFCIVFGVRRFRRLEVPSSG